MFRNLITIIIVLVVAASAHAQGNRKIISYCESQTPAARERCYAAQDMDLSPMVVVMAQEVKTKNAAKIASDAKLSTTQKAEFKIRDKAFDRDGTKFCRNEAKCTADAIKAYNNGTVAWYRKATSRG